MGMLPTKKTPPKTTSADLTVLVYGRPKIGKCLGGSTKIADPARDRQRRLRHLVEDQASRVYTLAADGCLIAATPTRFIENPPDRLYRLTTFSGKSIDATSEHPFLTQDGWKPLSALDANDTVAIVSAYPSAVVPAGACIFDPIVRVEALGIEPVFDLEIPHTHNFVANDFIVHNSTMCSHADGALFLATEPGLNHLDVYQVPITSWEQLLDAAAEIAKGDHPFRTIVVDTIDNAYRFCQEHVCAKNGVKHPSDLPYGKGYALVNGEFHRVITKLASLPYGLFLTSHAQDHEVEGRTGKYNKVTPTLPDGARKILLGLVDIILFADVETEPRPDGGTTTRRVLRTKPAKHYEAGDRTGRLPETLALDYAAFTAALAAGKPAAPVPQVPQTPQAAPAAQPPKIAKPTK